MLRDIPMDHDGGMLRRVWARLKRPRPRARLVRRAAIRCPHTARRVEIELVLGPTGAPDLVLRCSIRPECPPACDQACRSLAEAVVGPARALLVLPPGEHVPQLFD
jgi:hypothetical protein